MSSRETELLMPLQRCLVLLLSSNLAGCVTEIPYGLWKDAAQTDRRRDVSNDLALDQAADRPLDSDLGDGSALDHGPGDKGPALDQRPYDKRAAGPAARRQEAGPGAEADRPEADRPEADRPEAT